MLAAAPDAPLPPPRREYDGGPSVDPGPQMRQRITLPEAPLPPKPGLMRKIIGTAASLYLPPVGREILAPGYDRQMREYNANKQRQMDEGKLNIQAADEQNKIAMSRKAMADAEAANARKEAELARAGSYGYSNVPQGSTRVGPDGRVIFANPLPPKAEAQPNTFEAAALRAINIEDPVKRKEALDALFAAKAGMNPEKPIVQTKVGADGQIVAVTIDPKKVAEAGGSMTVGRVQPKPVKASAASERKAEEALSAEDTANEIIEGRQDFHGLTASEKKAVRPFLTKKKWTEPHNYSESEKQSLTGLDGLKRLSSELKPFFAKGQSAAGTGMFVGHAPNWTVSEQGKEIRTKLADMASSVILARSGKAVTPHEMTRIEKFIPTETDTDEQIRVKLDNLDAALETGRASIGRYAKGGQPQAPAAGNAPAEKPGSPPTKPKLSTLAPPPQGMVYMWKKSTGQLQRVPSGKVQAALASKDYEEVK